MSRFVQENCETWMVERSYSVLLWCVRDKSYNLKTIQSHFSFLRGIRPWHTSSEIELNVILNKIRPKRSFKKRTFTPAGKHLQLPLIRGDVIGRCGSEAPPSLMWKIEVRRLQVKTWTHIESLFREETEVVLQIESDTDTVFHVWYCKAANGILLQTSFYC